MRQGGCNLDPVVKHWINKSIIITFYYLSSIKWTMRMASRRMPTATAIKIVLKKTKKMSGFNVKYILEGGGTALEGCRWWWGRAAWVWWPPARPPPPAREFFLDLLIRLRVPLDYCGSPKRRASKFIDRLCSSIVKQPIDMHSHWGLWLRLSTWGWALDHSLPM